MDHVKVLHVLALFCLKCANIFSQLKFSSRYQTNLLVYTIGKKTFNLQTRLISGKKKIAGRKKNKSTSKRKGPKEKSATVLANFFYEKVYPQEANDLIVVTKLSRQFFNPNSVVPTLSSSESPTVYFHSSGKCIRRCNICFVPKQFQVRKNFKNIFSDEHKTFLHALGVCL